MLKTHEIEVVIPEDHRLTVEVPDTIRSGPAKLILLVPVEASQPDRQNAERTRSEEIDHLYSELRELMARSAAGDELDVQIENRFRRLRALQEEEADAIEARFRAQHRLQPGEGLRALEHARKIIENESPT